MSSTITAISQVLDAFGRVPLIVAALTKGTLLILIAVGLTGVLGRAPAAARHLIWSLAVAGLLLLPATSVIPWHLELTALSAARDALAPTTAATPRFDATRSSVDNGITGSPSSAGAQRRPATSTSDQPPAAPDQSRIRRTDPATILLLAWSAGMLWMFGRLVIGMVAIRRIVRPAVPADGSEWQSLVESARSALGTRPAARIMISSEAAMPFTYGLVRPVIVLPSSVDEWTTDRRRSVLLHELAHLRRRDLLTNAIVQLACAVYWFHPLVRLAGRRVRIEAERACDALVVAAGTRPSDYAGDLLDIARTMRSSPAAAVALAMARQSDFEGRLLAILAPDSGRNVLTAARAAIVALSFAVPAVAIAAAVPASHVAPNAVNRTTDTRTPAGPVVTDAESAALPPSVAAAIAQGTSTDSQAPAKTQGRDTAVPALLSVVTDSSPAVRLAAVEALGNLADPRAIDALVQALRTDTDAKVREAAAESLGEIDNPRAVPGLIAALGSERVSAVRAKIASALGEIDDARAADALSAAVRDTAVEVRRAAVEALGEIEAVSGVPALLSVLRDPDVETRKQAVAALGEIKSPEAIDGVSAATKDADAEVRKAAVESLGNISDKRALPALEAATRDAEVEVRRQAVEAIGSLDGLHSAPQALIAATRDTDREVRKAAAEALGNLEDEAAVPALIPLTRDANGEVKRSAVEALANIGGARAVEVMAALLKDEDPEIRKLAAQALGKK